jgi:hypothetical protein
MISTADQYSSSQNQRPRLGVGNFKDDFARGDEVTTGKIIPPLSNARD